MVKIWADSSLEDKLLASGTCIVAGADEVGRGALAGPLVVSCAVCDSQFNTRVCDSKFLSPKQREAIFNNLKNDLVCFSTAIVESSEIDEYGLANSLRLGFFRALVEIPIAISEVIIDGPVNYLSDYDLGLAYIKADQHHQSVAAASIIAKVTRDKIMQEYALLFPEYGFNSHVGYGTKQHINAIKKYGLTNIHRRSFSINV